MWKATGESSEQTVRGYQQRPVALTDVHWGLFRVAVAVGQSPRLRNPSDTLLALECLSVGRECPQPNRPRTNERPERGHPEPSEPKPPQSSQQLRG
jgi:hypothetical protein